MKFLQLSLAAGLLFSVSYSAWASSDQLWIIGGPNSFGPNQSDAVECTATDQPGVFTYVWDKAESDGNNFGFVDGGFGDWGTLNAKRYGSYIADNDEVSVGGTYNATYANSNTWVLNGTGKYLLTFDTNTNTLKVEEYTEGGGNEGGDSKTYEAGWALNGQFKGSSWDATPFAATDVKGVWSVTMTPTQASGEFGVRSLDNNNQQKHWYGCAATLSEGNSQIDIKDGGNSKFNLTAGKEYTFVLDERGNTPTLTVSWVDVPVETAYTLQWGTGNASGNNVTFEKDGDSDNYTCTFTPNVASGKFGITATGGKTGWFGNQNATLSESNKSVTLMVNGGETSFNLTAGREYTLILNPETMELYAAWTVVDTHPEDVKLTGDFNDWGFGTLMTRVGDTSTYTISGVSLNGEFKIADGSDWTSAGYKVWGNKIFSESDNSQVLEEAHGEGNNMKIASPYERVENATLTFDYDTKTLTIDGTWINPNEPEFTSLTTVYFINSANWGSPCVYLYDATRFVDGDKRPANAAWPGVKLENSSDLAVDQVTLTDELGNKIENVYSITWDASKGWTNVIFNNGNKDGSSLTNGDQTADCGVEHRGVYSNARHSEFGGTTDQTNGHYNMVGPIAYFVDGFYYPARQSAATEEFKCFYNDHMDWGECWVYILQGGETKTRRMYKGKNQFGRECWVLPTKEDMEALGAKESDLISLSTALQDFQIWFANVDKDGSGYNNEGNRRKQGVTLQNFEIYEDAPDNVKVTIEGKEYFTYNGIMTLYVKGNVYVNGESAQTTPQPLKRNPQAGRFYAKVKPVEGTDGDFFLVRSTSENTDITNNIWIPGADAKEPLVAGGEKHYTLTPHDGKEFDSVNSFYVLDNTAVPDGTSVLVVKMREKSIHNIIPSPDLKLEYVTQMGNSDLDGVNKTSKHGRVQRHGGMKLNVTASNYFEDFSKCSLSFQYRPGNGNENETVAGYVEPIFFKLHENDGAASAQADNALSGNGSSVIGSYRVFFMTPGLYTVTVANDQGEDPIYETVEDSEAETAVYATPTSIGMQINYSEVVAETTANADDAATFKSDFPNYTIWFAWCDGEKDENVNIVNQLVSGTDIRDGSVTTGNKEYDEKAQEGADADIWYVRATPANARLSYSNELNADPSSFQVWIPAALAGKNPSEESADSNVLRRAVSNPETAPAGYVKYDPYTGVNLSNTDNFNVIIDQNGVRSETYDIAVKRIDDVTTGIDDIEAGAFEEEAAPVYYNLNGLMVSGEHLTPGIYVEVRGSKTRKIIVR